MMMIIIITGIIMIIPSPLPDPMPGMKIEYPSQEPADPSADLTNNVHRRAGLQDRDEDEEGYADRDQGSRKSPVGYRDGDCRHAEYALRACENTLAKMMIMCIII